MRTFDDTARTRVIRFYHTEDKEGISTVEVNGEQGFYGAISAAEASQNNKAFRKLESAITAGKPKIAEGWETEGGPKGAWMAQGEGEPTVHTDSTETYTLCYYVEWGSRLKRGVQDGAGCLGTTTCTLLFRIRSAYLPN